MKPVYLEDGELKLIDQTKLPTEFIVHSYTDYRKIAKAIVDMIVRGAPAIGVTAGYGVYFVAFEYENEPKDFFYDKMKEVFQINWVVVLYVLGCISLAWHLLHGFQSAFRTIGVSNKKYLGLLNAVGIGFSIIIPLAFALMPVSFYLGWIE